MSLALALKYRPTTFEDLIGQHAVSQTLSLALDSKHISHAYLFSGLRGSGKTSSARIFSRSLQCDNGPTSKPCGECQNCKAALEGRHLDIIEMDAASSRKIDDIRDLIEQTKYRPAFGRYKIFIIDEVHMLTREAFNALLKTLEEPPEYVKFILATTDPLKLPPTILSRTQHFRFKQIPQRLVVEHIAHILDKEQVRYETKALEIIARSGSGSLRDTLTLLDQAIIFCKNNIDTSGVTDMLGIVDPQIFSTLFGYLLAQNFEHVKESMGALQEYESEMILDEMMLFLKDRLLANDKAFPPLILDRFFRILVDSKILLTHNTDGSFVLLLTLLKMQEALKIKEVDAMIADLEAQIFATPKPQQGTPSTHTSAPSLVQSRAPSLVQATGQAPIQTSQAPLQAPKIQSPFEILTQKLYDRNFELGECFARCVSFVSFEGDTLTWHSSAVGEDRERLAKHFEIIKAFVAQVFGAQTKISAQKLPPTPQPQSSQMAQGMAAQGQMAQEQATQGAQIETTHDMARDMGARADSLDSQNTQTITESTESSALDSQATPPQEAQKPQAPQPTPQEAQAKGQSEAQAPQAVEQEAESETGRESAKDPQALQESKESHEAKDSQEPQDSQSLPKSQKEQDREFMEHNKEIVASLEAHLGIKDYFKS